MNLLVVSTWLPAPPDNGSRQRAFHLLRHLGRRHAVTLLAFGVPRSDEDLAVLGSLCARVETVPPSPRPRRLGLTGLLSAVPRHFVQTHSARMTRLLDSHAGSHDAALALQVDAAVYLARRLELPRVFDEVEVGLYRDAVSGASPVGRLRPGLTWWKFRRFVRGLVQDFDRSTVVSGLEREHLLGIGCEAERIAVVPNGAEVPGTVRRPAHSTQLVYPGSVTYAPNLDAVRYFVQEVLPLVRRVRPDVTFLVTGETRGVDLGELAAREGVRFSGWVPDVQPAVTESAVCVIPLRTGGGTRLKVLQAMALGTPVVSTSKGVEGLEVLADRHFLLADNRHDFAAQVLRLLGDRPLSDALARQARELARERYSWEAIGDRLEAVIAEAVRHHAGKGLGSGPLAASPSF